VIAVLLAAAWDARVDWLNSTLAVVGIVVAHVANNLMKRRAGGLLILGPLGWAIWSAVR
jgi:divalent metal cation (Fe/Co/Zn/Cd) transporter